MSTIGPRFNGKRVPMSFTDDELLALGCYRNTLRELDRAVTDERRAVRDCVQRSVLEAAYRRTQAARELHSASVAALNATLRED